MQHAINSILSRTKVSGQGMHPVQSGWSRNIAEICWYAGLKLGMDSFCYGAPTFYLLKGNLVRRGPGHQCSITESSREQISKFQLLAFCHLAS